MPYLGCETKNVPSYELDLQVVECLRHRSIGEVAIELPRANATVGSFFVSISNETELTIRFPDMMSPKWYSSNPCCNTTRFDRLWGTEARNESSKKH